MVTQALFARDAVMAPRGATTVRLGDAVLDASGAALAERARVAEGAHEVAWDVRLIPEAPPLVPFPSRRLYEGRFPKKKLLTPIPRGRLEGWIEVDGARHALDGWAGLHGHNWGSEHAYRYAYANGQFAGGAQVDGYSAKVRLGPLTSPWLSLVIVRLPDGRELRFDRPTRWLRGRPRVGPDQWAVDLPGAHGTLLRLTLKTQPADTVGLRYRYPDGRIGYCRNTKFAHGSLRVEEHGRVLYEGTTDLGELEIFGPTPLPGSTYHGG